MNANPLVSICIPSYNAAKYIKQTLDCLINQSYKNLEILVVDDGSKDDTLSIINSYTDKRLSIFIQENSGAGTARNLAFNNAKGSLIKFMDGDDLLSVNAIAEQVNLALKHPHAIISSKWGRFYNDDLKTFTYAIESVWRNIKGIDWIIESWQKGPNMTQPGIFLLPRAHIEKYGVWLEKLSEGPNDDMEFFTRMMVNCEQIIFCDQSILYYRSGIQGSLSRKKDRIGFERYLETIEISIGHVLRKINSLHSSAAAATQLQSFVYNCYGLHDDLCVKAQNQIKTLGGTNYPFPAGGLTKIISKLIGWKLTKKLKIRLQIFI